MDQLYGETTSTAYLMYYIPVLPIRGTTNHMYKLDVCTIYQL